MAQPVAVAQTMDQHDSNSDTNSNSDREIDPATEVARQKRKYARGGRRKLKTISALLANHLSEMLATSENERYNFYAKIMAMEEVKASGATRDEVRAPCLLLF